MEIQKIVVPVDFSEFSDKAVGIAEKIAQKFNANITLAHVIITHPQTHYSDDPESYQALIQKRQTHVEQQFAVQFEERDAQKSPMDFVILRGLSPADCLQEFIINNDYDLVVLGTHGKSGYRHFVQGSVAEKLVQVSPIPVLTVHHSLDAPQIKRILVPVDFSSYSQQALYFADEIARKFAAKLVFLHVIEQEIYPSFYGEDLESIFEVDPNLSHAVVENLKEFVEDFVEDEFVENFIVREGVAHKEIVECAKDNFDLLIIATHGLSGLEYLLLGGTSEKVIRWATCPVLVVKRNDV